MMADKEKGKKINKIDDCVEYDKRGYLTGEGYDRLRDELDEAIVEQEVRKKKNELTCKEKCEKIDGICKSIKYDEWGYLTEEEYDRLRGELDESVADLETRKKELEKDEAVVEYLEIETILRYKSRKVGDLISQLPK